MTLQADFQPGPFDTRLADALQKVVRSINSRRKLKTRGFLQETGNTGLNLLFLSDLERLLDDKS